jgi:hypothetical protein
MSLRVQHRQFFVDVVALSAYRFPTLYTMLHAMVHDWPLQFTVVYVKVATGTLQQSCRMMVWSVDG